MRFPSIRIPAALLLTLLAALSGCENPKLPKPDPSSRPLTVGTEVQDALAAGDTHLFHFTEPAGRTAKVYLRTRGAGAGQLRLDVLDARQTLLGVVTATAADSVLGERATLDIPLAAGERYTVRVRGASETDGGAYGFVVTSMNREAVAIGDTVDWQAIDVPGENDAFRFRGQAGQEIIVFVQALRASNPNPVELRVIDPRSTSPLEPERVLAVGRSHGGDPELEANGTGRFVLPATGDYDLVVRDAGFPEPYLGPYRFWIAAVDRRPERLPRAVVAGDTVSGEAIDHVGDVDEFLFTAAAGQEFNVFFQAGAAPADARLRLDVLDAAGEMLGTVVSTPTDTALTTQATGRIRSAGGSHTLRVLGDRDRGALDRGAFRLLLYPVDRRPETVSASLVLGDSVVAEAIELPGDVDEFSLLVPARALANFVVSHGGMSPDAVTLTLVDPTTGRADRIAAGYDGPVGRVTGPSGTMTLEAGTYTLRVEGGHSVGWGYRGPYRLRTIRIDERPEHVPALVAVGQTVEGESLSPLGDVDVFRFDGRRGQHLDVQFQGMGEASEFGYWLAVLDPRTGRPLAAATSPTRAPTLGSHRTHRFTLPESGEYRIRVWPGNDGRILPEEGPYRFALVEVPTAPEHVAPAVAVGDSVAGERIDHPGDIDDFVVTGQPSQEVAVFFQMGSEWGQLELQVFDAAADTLITRRVTNNHVHSTGRFGLPAGGRVRLQFMEPRGRCEFVYECAAGPSMTGPYWFRVLAIDRAPESVPPAVSIGQVVEGEAIAPAGDIDEFGFHGNAGTVVRAYFQTPLGTWTGSDGLVLEILEPGTGRVLGSVGSLNPTPRLEDQATPDIALTASGTYTVRVRGSDDRMDTGRYRFQIQRVD